MISLIIHYNELTSITNTLIAVVKSAARCYFIDSLHLLQPMQPEFNRQHLTRLFAERKQLKSSRRESRNPERLLVQQNRSLEANELRLRANAEDNCGGEVEEHFDSKRFDDYNR